ncbi:hypothetical protein Vau01_016730 [Virgisporangium aurantiacum]|uniref:Uncharacterized protein n=1 Tax=Virgisporangium aurantiacum TaxID=175570 RepID=A0A8J3Z0P1_9ACTN|nr:hypothetical protein Vau01_016730 [Virgisporangium aurantiacum]
MGDRADPGLTEIRSSESGVAPAAKNSVASIGQVVASALSAGDTATAAMGPGIVTRWRNGVLPDPWNHR